MNPSTGSAGKLTASEINSIVHKKFGCEEDEATVRCKRWNNCQCRPYAEGYKAAMEEYAAQSAEPANDVEIMDEWQFFKKVMIPMLSFSKGFSADPYAGRWAKEYAEYRLQYQQSQAPSAGVSKEQVAAFLAFFGKTGLYINEDGTVWQDAYSDQPTTRVVSVDELYEKYLATLTQPHP